MCSSHAVGERDQNAALDYPRERRVDALLVSRWRAGRRRSFFRRSVSRSTGGCSDQGGRASDGNLGPGEMTSEPRGGRSHEAAAQLGRRAPPARAGFAMSRRARIGPPRGPRRNWRAATTDRPPAPGGSQRLTSAAMSGRRGSRSSPPSTKAWKTHVLSNPGPKRKGAPVARSAPRKSYPRRTSASRTGTTGGLSRGRTSYARRRAGRG